MICPKCGSQNKENACFCAKCGGDLQQTYEIKNNNKSIPIIVSVLAVLLVVFVGIIVYSQNSGMDSGYSADSDYDETDDELYDEEVDDEYDDLEEEFQESTEKELSTNYQNSDETIESIPTDPLDNLDVEKEVAQIRNWYNAPTDREQKVILNNGANGWDYSREYYFHDNKLYFAFIYDGTEEHRLYFKDDIMIRYIDEYGEIYDYDSTIQFSDWEQKAITEAYENF